MTRREQAMAYFKQGFNCSQSVLRAYSDLFDMPEDELMKAGQSFGGGMGRLRLVAGALTGSADPSDRESKKNNYDVVQKLAARFEEENGSLICGQLLGLDGDVSKVHPKYAEGTTPEPRTQEYYKKRPCIELVGQVCDILDSYFGEKIQEETKG